MNKVGIIGAMELEVAELKSKMQVKNVVEKAGMKFHEGVLNGKDVVIVQCGIGKVNAGICVQILADVFGVDAVINTGVAGSLRAEINIGDIVVSTDACEAGRGGDRCLQGSESGDRRVRGTCGQR